MIAGEGIVSTQELNHHQAFLPIFATLFFAATTSPILMAFGGYEAQSRDIGPIREGKAGNPVVVAQCELAEHGEPGHRCDHDRT